MIKLFITIQKLYASQDLNVFYFKVFLDGIQELDQYVDPIGLAVLQTPSRIALTHIQYQIPIGTFFCQAD